MSHPLLFRGVTYFYPIGNTSAIWLTEHLPPEQQANILLLACGDPRHILYTIHTNDTHSSIGGYPRVISFARTTNMTCAEPQKLDVTCCDVEAAVLGRFPCFSLFVGVLKCRLSTQRNSVHALSGRRCSRQDGPHMEYLLPPHVGPRIVVLTHRAVS